MSNKYIIDISIKELMNEEEGTYTEAIDYSLNSEQMRIIGAEDGERLVFWNGDADESGDIALNQAIALFKIPSTFEKTDDDE